MKKYLLLVISIVLFFSCEDKQEKDCAGVEGGTAVLDNCGVCEGNNDTCISDIDGNVYETVQIGEQVWMAENLKVTHYRNGDEIPTGYSDDDWINLTTGAYAVYDDNESNADTYGYLYNWYVVEDDRGVCPAGWHIPTDDEFTVLIDYLGGESVAGGKMKEAGIEHWISPNEGATNESGFTGLPSGCRYSDGRYINIYNIGYFWSSTESSDSNARYQGLLYNTPAVLKNGVNKGYGLSIRCLKD